MKLHLVRLIVVCGLQAGLLPCPSLMAQPQNPIAVTPPLPPTPRSPIDYFRDLLTATPEGREKLLAEKTPEHRKVLENSVRSYQTLTPEERELRLRTMELRYHLTSLLRVAPTNRAARLKLVPERDRPLVEDRIKIWDGLSMGEQAEALENERMIRIMAAVNSGVTGKDVPLSGQTSNQFRQIEVQLVRWQSLPENRRAQVQRIFTNLFELTDAEKTAEKLQPLPLSEVERQSMEKTLEQFRKLRPTQRDTCVRNFKQFSEMSPAERRQFLVNAEEWQKMKPEDREAWRRLVSKVPPLPPFPPGFGQPPLPQRASPSAISTAQNTNR